MGRYTSVQTFSDSNTKLISSSNAAEPRGGGGEGESIGAKPTKLVVEKVEVLMGSCAGAGSGEFDVYRASRRRELTRLETIEQKQKEDFEAKFYEAKILRNKQEAEERTKKNAEKRKKRKARQLQSKASSTSDNGVSVEDDDNDENIASKVQRVSQHGA